MKTFAQFISESLSDGVTFYFPNAIILALYAFEGEGQIMTGEDSGYETWWDKVKVEQGNPGYKADEEIHPYTFDGLTKDEQTKDDMTSYAIMAQVLGFDFIKELFTKKLCDKIHSYFEVIGGMVYNKTPFEEASKSFDDKLRKYGVRPASSEIAPYIKKIFNKEVYDKYLSVDYDDIKLKNDLLKLNKVFKNKLG